MKTLTALALLALICSAPALAQEMPPPAAPSANHEWLQQLVGEWRVSCEATMAPGEEPMKMESKVSVRSIGGLWILAEGTANLGGLQMTTLLTLGHDSRKGVFVGTWVDTFQDYLWTYEGRLDEARKVLTLEAEGPTWNDPAKTSRYRDVIEVMGREHFVLTSWLQGEDG